MRKIEYYKEGVSLDYYTMNDIEGLSNYLSEAIKEGYNELEANDHIDSCTIQAYKVRELSKEEERAEMMDSIQESIIEQQQRKKTLLEQIKKIEKRELDYITGLNDLK